MKEELRKIQLRLTQLRDAAIQSHGSGDTWKHEDNVCCHLNYCVLNLGTALKCLEEHKFPGEVSRYQVHDETVIVTKPGTDPKEVMEAIRKLLTVKKHLSGE